MRQTFLGVSLAALACMMMPTGLPGESADGFQPLFNGKDLSGWKVFGGKQSAWGADHGIVYTTGEGGGWLLTEKQYADFEMRLEYKLPKGGNSGVGIRCPLEGNVSYTGMEIQLLDDPWYKDPKNFKGIRRVQLTGAIYGVVPPSKEVVKPAGQWNKMHIIARGRQITVILNGTTIVDADLDRYKAHTKEHPGLLRTAGHLGLQSHTDRVEFRHVAVKPLNTTK